MNLRLALAAVSLAALGLAGCNDNRNAAANTGFCYDFKAKTPAAPAAPTASGGDLAAPLEDCVRRWAYSLAPSKDDADAVADAAVAACGAHLSRWNQQSLTQQGGAPGGEEALSITTGQPTNPMAEHNTFAHGRALLYVVQARAGNCRPPPAANGVPEGASG
jgi:hypothetical protein